MTKSNKKFLKSIKKISVFFFLLVFLIVAVLVIGIVGFVWLRNQNPQSQIRTPISSTPTDTQNGETCQIQLKSRQFTPEAGVKIGLDFVQSATEPKGHVLIQLFAAPDAEARTLLESSQIELLDFVPCNAWFASIPSDLQVDDPAMRLVRWLGPILPDDKVSPALREGRIGKWALREGNKVALVVSIFENVSLSEGEEVVLKYDAQITTTTSLSNKLTIELPQEKIMALAQEDIVRWIDLVSPPSTVDEN